MLPTQPQHLIIPSIQVIYIYTYDSSFRRCTHALVNLSYIFKIAMKTMVYTREEPQKCYDFSSQWIIRWCYACIISPRFHCNCIYIYNNTAFIPPPCYVMTRDNGDLSSSSICKRFFYLRHSRSLFEQTSLIIASVYTFPWLRLNKFSLIIRGHGSRAQ